jgi:hypothetical protein
MVGVAFLLRWFASAEPRTVARVITYVAIGLGIIGIIFVIVVDRLGWLPVAASPLLLALLRKLALRRVRQPASGPGRTSRVDTRWLGMMLDHGSGTLDGTVRQGRFAGRRLAELSLDDLLDLHDECRGDPESVSVLEAFLDRVHPGVWRERVAARDAAATDVPPRRTAGMTREEAYQVLELAPGASEAEIREAHRRLMLKVHPDHGGSTWLAAQINQAKDLLLGTG